ncbi:hypothetical protein BpHYR1_021038 [Brachionus plicatilis]|uniref:Uncharacterized protein n=1 Tax=Brachionus plicatilis TaxID=10195 RepID=A0A3M7R767_BRAPC|nr:hypothetical protein BpHYR1_021038 [Brachionus plicatilis]
MMNKKAHSFSRALVWVRFFWVWWAIRRYRRHSLERKTIVFVWSIRSFNSISCFDWSSSLKNPTCDQVSAFGDLPDHYIRRKQQHERH